MRIVVVVIVGGRSSSSSSSSSSISSSTSLTHTMWCLAVAEAGTDAKWFVGRPVQALVLNRTIAVYIRSGAKRTGEGLEVSTKGYLGVRKDCVWISLRLVSSYGFTMLRW